MVALFRKGLSTRPVEEARCIPAAIAAAVEMGFVELTSLILETR